MFSRAARSIHPHVRHVRAYAVRPDIPILPPNRPPKSRDEEYAVPPMLPPDMGSTVNSDRSNEKLAAEAVVKDDAVPFGTAPIVLENEPVAPKVSHRLRNTVLSTVLLGALLFGGGVYGSLENDTIYEMFTEFVPYGEEAVLYLQDREFRRRFPNARTQSKQLNRVSDPSNVYIPQSGAMPTIREDPPKVTEAKILQAGPQNSALKPTEHATPNGANDAAAVNRIDAGKQASAGTPTNEGLDKTGKLPESKSASTEQVSKPAAISGLNHKDASDAAPSKLTSGPAPASAPAPSPAPALPPTKTSSPTEMQKGAAVQPVPPPSAPIKTFDIPQPNHKSIERLQFALNGIIKAANEYGTSQFFKDSLENAKDEVVSMNTQIAEVQAQEQLKSEKNLTAQSQEFGRMQQKQIADINAQITEYEHEMTLQLEQERERLNQAYTERLADEVKRIEAVSEQKLQNELIQQSIEMQRKLTREVKSRVEEERGGRLGKLEGLQKSIAELKQLNVDSSSFIQERVKLQDLEVAMNALKSVLHESTSRPFVKELAAVREIAGDDELLKVTIDTIDRESYEAGVPTLGQLGDRFRSVAEEVRKAALLPEGAGVAGHASSWLLSKVMFRKRGMVPGDDAEAVLARTEAYLEANDLDSATREMNSLTGWAHIISSDWLKMARRYLELQQSIELMENSVVLQALRTQ